MFTTCDSTLRTVTVRTRTCTRAHTAPPLAADEKGIGRIAEKALGRDVEEITDLGRQQILGRTPSELLELMRIGIAAAEAAGYKVVWVTNTLDYQISTHGNGGFRSINMLLQAPDGIVIENQWQLVEIQAVKVCSPRMLCFARLGTVPGLRALSYIFLWGVVIGARVASRSLAYPRIRHQHARRVRLGGRR